MPGADQTTLTLARADEENLLRVSRHNLHALGVMLRYCRDERRWCASVPISRWPRIPTAFD
ncbi:MAG: hypothetical protein ACLT2T_05040 [Bilophila wadsworthia]